MILQMNTTDNTISYRQRELYCIQEYIREKSQQNISTLTLKLINSEK